MTWSAVPLEKLYDLVNRCEAEIRGPLSNLWQMIKIEPTKWQQHPYGDEGEGFWAVAIYGNSVVWYNDIEEGFNISQFNQYGEIAEYWCNQDSLQTALHRIMSLINIGPGLSGHAGPPEPLREPLTSRCSGPGQRSPYTLGVVLLRGPARVR